MCAIQIRLPDGRVVTPATERELLLDVLAEVLCGRLAMPLSQIKTLSCWVFRSGQKGATSASQSVCRNSIAARLAVSAGDSASRKESAGDGCRG